MMISRTSRSLVATTTGLVPPTSSTTTTMIRRIQAPNLSISTIMLPSSLVSHAVIRSTTRWASRYNQYVITTTTGRCSSQTGTARTTPRSYSSCCWWRHSPRGSSRPRLQAQQRHKASLASSSESSTSSTQQWSWHDSLADWIRQQRTIAIPRWVTPSHQTISIAEVFGHSSFALVALSYAVDDFLMLRCIAVIGSSAMLVFTYFHPHGRVLWLPFKWNVLFTLINSYRIGKILLYRHLAERLPSDYMALREEHFYLMEPVSFAKLVRLGTEELYNPGDFVTRQGEENRFVRLVLSGQLEAHWNGKMTYLLNEANFVAEAGLHSGLMLPGAVTSCCDVVASRKSRVLRWDRDELLHLMERDHDVHHALQNAMSWDIVRKLKTQRQLAAAAKSKGELGVDNFEEWTQRRNEQSQARYTAIVRNMLQHPSLLTKKGRVLLHNYRVIHRIDDEHHTQALKELGWTAEQFENPTSHLRTLREAEGRGVGKGIKWFVQDLYLRAFG